MWWWWWWLVEGSLRPVVTVIGGAVPAHREALTLVCNPLPPSAALPHPHTRTLANPSTCTPHTIRVHTRLASTPSLLLLLSHTRTPHTHPRAHPTPIHVHTRLACRRSRLPSPSSPRCTSRPKNALRRSAATTYVEGGLGVNNGRCTAHGAYVEGGLGVNNGRCTARNA